ncbi:hypothetical protein ACFSQT_01635 [Mesorhizobium calcicola]|uniref:Uncharacterized protein n=1 Tax=Mesorhizobium calcicola TaxID=1300310 RepID=A0ABW4W8F8_9HYPH
MASSRATLLIGLSLPPSDCAGDFPLGAPAYGEWQDQGIVGAFAQIVFDGSAFAAAARWEANVQGRARTFYRQEKRAKLYFNDGSSDVGVGSG